MVGLTKGKALKVRRVEGVFMGVDGNLGDEITYIYIYLLVGLEVAFKTPVKVSKLYILDLFFVDVFFFRIGIPWDKYYHAITTI